ncbi:MAG TPA: helix-turn-helix domain-containing protein [Gemmatimonadota bacterium]|jgi:transcriptional regulator with XRE-family HTH domain
MSRDKTLNDIGKRLHAARGELDQRALASLAHVSQQAVSNYERGNLPASWSFLRRLNEELGLNLNWLFSGHGSRELGSGGLCAALADNRSAEWPREFVAQVAFHSASPLEVPLSLYFLYLATEPADAKARLMADVQAVVEAARQSLESSEGGADPGLLEVLGALAGDDRRLAVEALIAAGESMERGRAAAGARRAYLAALGIARLQRWPGEEVEAARRVGRTYRKEGRWDEAERFFELALSSVSGAESHGVEPGGKAGVPPATAARAFLGAGHAARQSGNVVAARDRYRRALEWALRTDELALGAEVHLELACLAHRDRDWRAALDHAASGLLLAEQAGERRLAVNLHVVEALVLRERGDLEAAESALRALAGQAEAERDLAALSLVSSHLAELLLDLGRPDEAERTLARTAAAARAQGEPRGQALRKLLSARVAAARADGRAAHARLLEALRFTRQEGLEREFEQALAALEASGPPLETRASRAS